MRCTKVYILTGLNKLKLEDVLKFVEFMPKERIAKFERTVKQEKKIECVISYLFLCSVLKKNNILKKPGNIDYGKKRPVITLKENERVYFNISHSNNIIIVGLSHNKIGVDVEQIKDFNLKLAEKICTKKEFFKLLHSFNKKETFYLIWTKKEGFCKLKLKSIFFNFKLINSFKLKNSSSFKFKDYLININCKNCKPRKNIVFKQIKIEDLINF